MTPLPLDGIRVLEFSHAVLGPTCGMILADAGAEVIKVEPAPGGDPTRRLKGFGQGFAPYLFRNRKSLAVNLKRDEGKAIVRRLLDGTDVILENYGPGTMERLGFGYEQLAQGRPALIYCSLKGFFPGPYENRLALDEVVQMMSGLAYMTGPPGQPLRAGASIVDMMTGVYGAVGILLALREREQTGVGQLVRAALFETAVSLMGQHMAYSAVSGRQVEPMPIRVGAWGIYHKFEVEDGSLVFVGVTSDKQWHRFCDEFGRRDLLDHPAYTTNSDRVLNQAQLLAELRPMFRAMSKAAVIRRCEQANLPFSAIARPEDLFTDEHLAASGGLLHTRWTDGQEMALPRLPLLLDEHELELRHQPPRVGEHTREILESLAYSPETIASLEAAGTVALS